MTPERLSRLAKSRVAVIGDVMIDEYLIGRVERISPEAPVPVVRGVETRAAPGGAANVAANIAALGGRADLVGVVGLGGAPELAALLEPKGLVVCRLVEDANRRTIRKTRVMANRQQIVRLDREDTDPLAAEAEAGLIAAAGAAIAENDIVVVSDYGKGSISDTVLKAIIGMAKSAGRKVLVDPKRPEFTAYRGADLLTPNRSELARASGLPVDSDAQVEAAARVAQAQFGGDLLITRSEQGLAYIPLLGAPIYASTMAREVFDVSGAGDTVAATLAMALAAQFPMVEALQLANYAAGIVVGKAGTATVSLAELIAAMRTPNARSDGALAALAEARRLRESWERQGLTVGLTNGCFDLLHPGHVTLIAQAAAACDRLIVALNSDASVRRLKGPDRPVQDQMARASIMGALKGVASVVIFDEDTPYDLIASLQPDVIFKGADYRLEDVVGADLVRARGGQVILIDFVEGHSTTRLIRRG